MAPVFSVTSLTEFYQAVATGTFFAALADLRQARMGHLWPWLRLVPTAALEDWLFGAENAALIHLEAGDPTYRPLAACVLERHLLNLASRSNPIGLFQFWRRLSPVLEAGVADLWERANLPATVADPADVPIFKQESLFADVLKQAAGQLRRAVPWAATVAERLAVDRAGTVGEPFAQVVFASTGGDRLRLGMLVRFRLLAEWGGVGESLTDGGVFDTTFHKALQEVGSRLGVRMRRLGHDWGFLPQQALQDSSGFMALWLSQRFAAGGAALQGRLYRLPPWVVASAALDNGEVVPAQRIRRKCEHLIEEGVRILLIADEHSDPSVPLSFRTCRATEEGVDRPGADHLWVVRCRGTPEQLFHILRARSWLWGARVEGGPSRLFERVDTRRAGARKPQSFLTAHYLRPGFALKRIAEHFGRLGGRGYVHIQAPPTWGKTALADFLEKEGEREPHFGPVVRYQVLHGYLESPGVFLAGVYSRCVSLIGDYCDLPHPADSTTVEAMRERLAEVLRQTLAAKDRGRLILVVDGLDELTDEASGLGLLDALPEAPGLAIGCFVLLLSRPGLRPGAAASIARLRGPSHFLELPLTADTSDYQSIMRDFACARLACASSAIRR
jgi:hypothetical protein